MHRIRLFLPLLAAALVLLGAPVAHGATSTLVVSQVYAGGGNSGAAFANDFVELFNRGSSAVDLAGWTIQYASASSTSWSPTALSGSVQPGRYYLVQLASSAAVGSALPTPDATGTTNLANTGGKIALVHGTTALACGATAGSCASAAGLEDFVGYGSATDYEGSAAASSLSSTTALARDGSGCTDTDSNSVDFIVLAPGPRNSASPAASCDATPPPGESVSANAAVDIDIQSVLSISLERPTLSFGAAAAGDTPAAISEHVTVTSNNEAGYALAIHRTAFSPADLPLAVSASAPSGATLGGSLVGGVLAPIPVVPAPDLTIGSSTARSAASGDVWPTSIGFSSALPVVAPGRYTASVTYTLIGR
jgi:Lamin Tail Domain